MNTVSNVPPMDTQAEKHAPVQADEKPQIFLGLLPFLIIGFTLVLLEFPGQPDKVRMLNEAGGVLLILNLPLSLGMVLWGWHKGFPRWVFPYLFLAVVDTIFLTKSSTPGIVLFNVKFWGRQLWGWRAWVLPGIVALAGVLTCRLPWRGLKALVMGAWEDWTRLAFGLYGLMFYAFILHLDEVVHGFSFPAVLTGVFLMVAAAYLYLRFPHRTASVAWLVGGAFLGNLIGIFASELYWRTHEANLLDGLRQALAGEPNIWLVLNQAFFGAANMSVFLLAPALLLLLKSPKKPAAETPTE